ncbi:MAG: sulfide/dihydroorotate dehydrogenase-like FAD/NAD-binding protein [Mogibacterium sp.]|nr:sulfide/dihydroorotate dehydrogenase-like FAD/NAD-binding protein [Mogibacterium sp.]
MHKIIYKKQLSDDMFWMEFEAPYVAAKAKPGQFIIFRVDEYGERVPITMADSNKEKGTITLIFQAVGRSTMLLSQLEVGEYVQDIAGPLGKPTDVEARKRVCIVGGGTGNALAYPIAAGFKAAGATVDMISGFRTSDLIVLKDEFESVANNYYLCTDDGSAGEKAFTTDKLKALIEAGNEYDEVITVGPPVMMKFVAKTTEPYGIPTIASLSALMIDGTGMCGGCRISYEGETKYVCVDGPEFDASKVDWDVLIARNAYYAEEEKEAREHICRLTGGTRHYE